MSQRMWLSSDMSRRNTVASFREDLATFVSAIQEETGVQSTIVLPALPVRPPCPLPRECPSACNVIETRPAGALCSGLRWHLAGSADGR